VRLHQDFKRHVVVALPDGWTLTSDQVQQAIDEIAEEHGAVTET
jgi:hypothetical protein